MPYVLVVEDDQAVADELVEALKFRNFKAIGPVATVAAAITAIHERLPDMAILDWRLAGETSAPIARYLESRGVPFVFMTGSPEEVKAELPLALTLPKPARLSALLTTLDCIALKRAA